MGRLGWWIMILFLALAFLSVPGCRDDGQGGSGGQGVPTQPGSVVWCWPPSPATPEEAVSTSVVFFRFEEAPDASTLKAEVRPHFDFRLIPAGEIVSVLLEELHTPQSRRVALYDVATGAELAATYIAGPRGWASDRPRIIVREGRRIDYPSGGYLAEAGPEPAAALTDGAETVVSFGEIVVDIWVPGAVSEDSLRGAVVIEPEPASAIYSSAGSTTSKLEFRFPGVNARSGEPFPDPLAVLSSGQAPACFALEMKVTLNLGKLPASAGGGAAGEDGLYDVSVVRRAAPEFTVETRENLTGSQTMMPESREVFPYPGYRDQWWVRPEPHTFWISFTKPMDQPSVERTLVEPSVRNPVPGIAWTFDWLSDRTLKVTVEPSDPYGIPVVTSINPVGAVDSEGGAVWFTEPLMLKWADASEVVAVPATTSGAPYQVLLPADGHPTGAYVVDMHSFLDPEPASTDRIYLAVEPCRDREGDWPDQRLVWVGLSGIALDWADLSVLVEPCWSAEIIGGGRVFIHRYGSWETLSAESLGLTGQVSRVTVDSEAYRWFGFHPSPDGERVAAFRSAVAAADHAQAVDLVIFDLQGRELAVTPGVTYVYPHELRLPLHLTTIPAGWLPDGSGVVFVDRPEEGAQARLAWLDLSDPANPGAVQPVPVSGNYERDLGHSRDDAFAVWAGPPGEPAAGSQGSSPSTVYVGAVHYHSQEGLYYRVIELGTGREVFPVWAFPDQVPLDIDRAFPAPDGRYLALTGHGTTSVIDLAEGKVVAEHQGRAVGWSADSELLYLVRAGEWGPPGE